MLKAVQVRNRAYVLFGIVVAVFALCAVVLVKVQIFDGPALFEQARRWRTQSAIIPAPRGQIIDSRGTVLASSEKVYDVGIVPYLAKDYKHYEYVDASGNVVPNPTKEMIKSGALTYKLMGVGPAEVAKVLAPLLDMDRGDLGGRILAERSYLVVKRGLTVERWNAVKKLRIPGVQGDERYERSYPNGNVASTIIGFTIDGKGAAGIEATQDKILHGKDGKFTAERAPGGDLIPDGYRSESDAVAGSSVKLTINADLNNYAQQLADKTKANFGAEWVAIVLQEVKTGKIIVMASSGELAPEETRKGKGTRASLAVQYAYEPGSVGKLVTFASALEKNAISPLTPYHLASTATAPNGEKFKDAEPHGVWNLTAAGALAKSLNTGTIRVGDTVSDEFRFEMMRKLGWGERTGIEMPGETAGIVRDYKRWGKRQRYTTMFGQGLAVSPLQTNSMVATIANNGVKMPVHIVEGYIDPKGVYTPAEHKAPERVMDKDAAATLLRMMGGVTTRDGTSWTAAVPGYHTGGKSGTTEILTAGKGVVASFAGVAPLEDPYFACTVVVYRPIVSEWGSVVAGPVFSQIMERALRMYSIAPSAEPLKLYPIWLDR